MLQEVRSIMQQEADQKDLQLATVRHKLEDDSRQKDQLVATLTAKLERVKADAETKQQMLLRDAVELECEKDCVDSQGNEVKGAKCADFSAGESSRGGRSRSILNTANSFSSQCTGVDQADDDVTEKHCGDMHNRVEQMAAPSGNQQVAQCTESQSYRAPRAVSNRAEQLRVLEEQAAQLEAAKLGLNAAALLDTNHSHLKSQPLLGSDQEQRNNRSVSSQPGHEPFREEVQLQSSIGSTAGRKREVQLLGLAQQAAQLQEAQRALQSSFGR
jgi:hypothetical protein